MKVGAAPVGTPKYLPSTVTPLIAVGVNTFLATYGWNCSVMSASRPSASSDGTSPKFCTRHGTFCPAATALRSPVAVVGLSACLTNLILSLVCVALNLATIGSMFGAQAQYSTSTCPADVESSPSPPQAAIEKAMPTARAPAHHRLASPSIPCPPHPSHYRNRFLLKVGCRYSTVNSSLIETVTCPAPGGPCHDIPSCPGGHPPDR